ncbi:MAG: hypothetical protein JW876_10435 [Candidatus Krumholzibacteriota bacterium]|nr:hypothetical protein [Candidatus Krumholzibacteriota bacterium]
MYLSHFDGLLDEKQRILLQQHLDACAACAAFAGEMDRCLALVHDLPDVEPSENFEWNVKRRILEERARAVRSRGDLLIGSWRWGAKFAATAAAVAAVAVFAMTNWLGQAGMPSFAVEETHPAARTAAVRTEVDRGRTNMGYPPVLQMVSQEAFPVTKSVEPSRDLPIRFAGSDAADSLAAENRLLRERLLQLQRENLYYRQVIVRMRTRR